MTTEQATQTVSLAATRGEWLSVEVALGLYLDKFDINQISASPETSCLRNVLHAWNRCRNLSHGNALGYNLDRLPVRGQL